MFKDYLINIFMIEHASGWVASFFYSVCFLPQIYSTWKKQSPELNLNFMYMQFLGASFMFLYGLTNELYPIMTLNAFAWICIVFIIAGQHRNKTCAITEEDV